MVWCVWGGWEKRVGGVVVASDHSVAARFQVWAQWIVELKFVVGLSFNSCLQGALMNLRWIMTFVRTRW